jgi:hypothetical protein
MLERSPEITALSTMLWLALGLAPVTVALGCTDGNQRVDPPVDPPENGSAAGKTGRLRIGTVRADEPTTAVPPPPEFDLPTCPSGQWCASAASVEPFRVPADQLYGATDHEDCPGRIHVSGAEQAKLDDLPMAASLDIRLDVEATKTTRANGETDQCCYQWMEQCPGGRPLLDQGQPQLAPLQAGRRWTAALPDLDRAAIARLDPQTRRTVAEAWLADARMEHSSIASFARAGVELRAVDAPLGLIEGCARAAVDEGRHARICFGLAAAYGGPALEPRAMPTLAARPGGLIAVAIDTFIEGCVGETVAAACLRRAAREADDPALAVALARMADDEGDHAALAWQTLAWALERGGAPVRAAVLAVAGRLSPTHASEPDPEPQPGFSRGHGRLTPSAQARLRREAWAGVITPLLADLTRL